MRVYLDLCCYKRPFDDQAIHRVRQEASAVADILQRAEEGKVTVLRSPALILENEHNPREDRRLAAGLWINGVAEDVLPSDSVANRARELLGFGFRDLDALHVAFAEAGRARYFVTCDEGLLATARRHRNSLSVEFIRPDRFSRDSEQ